MKHIFFVLTLLTILSACSNLSQRYPASVDQNLDKTHEQYQGLFNR